MRENGVAGSITPFFSLPHPYRPPTPPPLSVSRLYSPVLHVLPSLHPPTNSTLPHPIIYPPIPNLASQYNFSPPLPSYAPIPLTPLYTIISPSTPLTPTHITLHNIPPFLLPPNHPSDSPTIFPLQTLACSLPITSSISTHVSSHPSFIHPTSTLP